MAAVKPSSQDGTEAALTRTRRRWASLRPGFAVLLTLALPSSAWSVWSAESSPQVNAAAPIQVRRPATSPSPSAPRLAMPSRSRLGTAARLARIRFVETEALDGLPLPAVLTYLNEQSVQRDPEGVGVNFLLNPMPVSPAAPVPMSEIKVHLPKMRQVSLLDVVNAVVRTADHPLQLSLESYGVVVAQRAAGPAPVFVGAFKADPNTFQQGLENVVGVPLGFGGGTGGNPQDVGSGYVLPRVDVSGANPGTLGGAGAGRGITGVTRTNLTQNTQDIVRAFFAPR